MDPNHKERWIETYKGHAFYFDHPEEDTIDIEDIAQSLSQICRYVGHTNRFFSVAEHCVLMVEYIQKELGLGLEQRLMVLLHDASETYTGDLSSPFKAYVGADFKEIENKIQEVICKKFRIKYPFPSWLKTLDTRMRLDEKNSVLNPSHNIWHTEGLEPLGIEIEGWSPETARNKFLLMFNLLMIERQQKRFNAYAR